MRVYERNGSESILLEMLETVGLQIPYAVAFSDLDRVCLIGDFPDPRDRNAVNSLWQTCDIVGLNGEKEFKVFATM